MSDHGKQRLSRRRFLQAGVAVASTVGAAKTATPMPERAPERERLERLLATYGSELGKLRTAR